MSGLAHQYLVNVTLANVLGLRERSPKIHFVGDSHMTRLWRKIPDLLGVFVMYREKFVLGFIYSVLAVNGNPSCINPLPNFPLQTHYFGLDLKHVVLH